MAFGSLNPKFRDFLAWLKPLIIYTGFTSAPFASANAEDDKKFLKCVGMDNTVFAYCDTAFGVKNKFLYAPDAVLAAKLPLSPLIHSNAFEALLNAAVSLDVY